jgi:hypothetical protein
MAFYETDAQRNDRLQYKPYFTILDETRPGHTLHPLQEVTCFKYLGYNLDQTLSRRSATSSMLQAFWSAHHQAHKACLLRREHHPSFLLTLWKQLILSTTDTHLVFIHNKEHLKKLDAAINTSLALTFAPHSWKTNILHTALKAEL